MKCEVTHTLERWSSARGNLRAQNAAYRLAWGIIVGWRGEKMSKKIQSKVLLLVEVSFYQSVGVNNGEFQP